MAENERELIARLTRGDTDAFGAIYDRHSPAVHRFVWPLLQDREFVADAVQETFLIAWRRRKSIRLAADSLLPWLLAIARFVAMNELRRQHRHPVGDLEDAVSMSEPELLAEARVQLAKVLEQLAGMEQLDRAILQLCIFDGLTYAQAAKRLHITPTAVGKRIERARKRLRRDAFFGLESKEH